MTLYTYGYSGGGSLDDLGGYTAAGAVILDIRFSPNSRVPIWRKEHLEAVLRDEYRWVPALGNRDYRSPGSIRIADLSAGLAIVDRYHDEGTPVVLLCACRDWQSCHRATVAEAIRRTTPGLTVRHLAHGETIYTRQE